MTPNQRETMHHAIGIIETAASVLKEDGLQGILFDAAEMLAAILEEKEK